MYKIELFDERLNNVGYSQITPSEMPFDYLTMEGFSVEVPKRLTVKKGYFAHITGGGFGDYDGFIADVRPSDKVTELQVCPLQCLFDVSVFTSPIEDASTWIADRIEELFINNEDEIQNRPIMLYHAELPETPMTVEENSTVNLMDIMVEALTTHRIVVDCKLSLAHGSRYILVYIFQNENAVTFDIDKANIISKSINLGDSYGSTNKLIIRKTQELADETITVLGDFPYYLHTDGSIDTDGTTNRITPVFSGCEIMEYREPGEGEEDTWEQEALDRAKEILSPEEYDNEIIISVPINDGLIRPLDRRIGDKAVMWDGDSCYTSILTGVNFELSGIELTFGKVRKELTKRLILKDRR